MAEICLRCLPACRRHLGHARHAPCASVSPDGGQKPFLISAGTPQGPSPGPSVLPRCSEEVKTPGEEVSKAKVHYNVEFTFDTDARVAITIYYQATEEFHNGVAR